VPTFVWQDAEGQRQAESWGGPEPGLPGADRQEATPEQASMLDADRHQAAPEPTTCRCGQALEVLTVWGDAPLPIPPLCPCGLPPDRCTCVQETA